MKNLITEEQKAKLKATFNRFMNITIVAATYFHLGLGWVVLIASPFALFLAWKKAH